MSAGALLFSELSKIDAQLNAKRFAQERHFYERAHDRFGLSVTPKRYRYWIRKVEDVLPGTRYVGPGDRAGRSIWIIKAGSHSLLVVYDEDTQRLVTCYPECPEAALPRKRVLKLRARAKFIDVDHLARARRLGRR